MGKVPITYVWQGGGLGSHDGVDIRAKTRIANTSEIYTGYLKDLSALRRAEVFGLGDWAFDGSSTGQAEGSYSDVILRPVLSVPDPFLKSATDDRACLVLCETMLPDGTPHPTNMRHVLVEAQKRYGEHEWQAGIEQEYTLCDLATGNPLALNRAVDNENQPPPQGRFYCGVGVESVGCSTSFAAVTRRIMDEHMLVCIAAGLDIEGTNLEVMDGQAEFQIGHSDPIRTDDHLFLARYFLKRVAEPYGVGVSFHPKPVKAMNGAGAHMNFSTAETRASGTANYGLKRIYTAIERIKESFPEICKVAGKGTDLRLTGEHETAKFGDFSSGVGNRGASVRIPTPVAKAGKGYFEVRTPSANVDPYMFSVAIMDAVSGNGFSVANYPGVKLFDGELADPV